MADAYQHICAEAGHEDCAFMVRSEDEDEVADMTIQHAADVHGDNHERNDVQDAIERVEWSAA